MVLSATVLVVAETPSLARSISDLLEIEGFRVRSVTDPRQELSHELDGEGRSVSLVICASNGFGCETARRWMRGEVSDLDLVVVGSRDPDLRSGAHIYVVGLPLAPDAFLTLVHHLAERARGEERGGPSRTVRRPGRPPRRRNPGSARNLSFARVHLAGPF